jgi:hypothetical protein
MLPLTIEQVADRDERSFAEQLTATIGTLDFAEVLPETTTPEQKDKLAPALLRYMLQSGDKGYKDGVGNITDAEGNPPNADNNWLFDGNGWAGRFAQADAPDRVFEFQIVQEDGGWVSTVLAVSGVDE